MSGGIRDLTMPFEIEEAIDRVWVSACSSRDGVLVTCDGIRIEKKKKKHTL